MAQEPRTTGRLERLNASEVIQREVAAIERPSDAGLLPPMVDPGDHPAEIVNPPEDTPPVATGDLQQAIRAAIRELRTPAGEAAENPPPPPQIQGSGVINQTPGRGAGMVYTGTNKPLFALCLSGGGIRSAAFCLGAVQTLARGNLLSEFHYLSTVSGGGYTGSLIARLISTMGGVVPAEQALADPRRAPSVSWLSTLRDYTSFLAPRLSFTSLDIWAAIALYVRNTVANWMLFLPGLIALALVPRLYLRLIEAAKAAGAGTASITCWFWLPAIIACVALTVAVISACLLVPGHQMEPDRPSVTTARVVRWITLPLVLGWAFCATLCFVMLLRSTWVYAIPLVAAVISIGGFIAALVYANFFGRVQSASMFWRNKWAWLGATLADSLILLAGIALAREYQPGPVVLAVVGPAWIVLAHLEHAAFYSVTRQEGKSSWMDREWIARLSASEVLQAMAWVGLATTTLVLPEWLHWLFGTYAAHAAVPAILAGPVAAWLGRSSATIAGSVMPKATLMKLLPSLLAVAASLIFLLTLLMAASAGGWRAAAWLVWAATWAIAWAVAWLTSGSFARVCSGNLIWANTLVDCGVAFWLTMLIGVVALLGLSLALGRWVININRFSLHELYRNRLVRAFLGSARVWRTRNADGFAHFDERDSMCLSEALPFHPDNSDPQRLRLFPVINTALNLTSGTRTAWAERKAASFTMTPLHCGSAVLSNNNGLSYDGAYVGTDIYGGSPLTFPRGATLPGIQLGTAMTISGAAVSPNAGYHSSGTTSFIMALFNARLGAWLPNPATASHDDMLKSRPPNGFRALVAEMLGQSDDTSPAVYLSDGGHFDNLGLYEMLRRRCRLIVVLDAGCDPKRAYYDLGDALRKARIDLNVEVTFASGAGPVTGKAPTGTYFKADILYPAGGAALPASNGILLYLKSHLPASVPADVMAYKASHKEFPNESTSNQFFTESQFESYRRLGEHLAA